MLRETLRVIQIALKPFKGDLKDNNINMNNIRIIRVLQNLLRRLVLLVKNQPTF